MMTQKVRERERETRDDFFGVIFDLVSLLLLLCALPIFFSSPREEKRREEGGLVRDGEEVALNQLSASQLHLTPI